MKKIACLVGIVFLSQTCFAAVSDVYGTWKFKRFELLKMFHDINITFTADAMIVKNTCSKNFFRKATATITVPVTYTETTINVLDKAENYVEKRGVDCNISVDKETLTYTLSADKKTLTITGNGDSPLELKKK